MVNLCAPRQDAERRLLQENHQREQGQQGVSASELQQRHQAEIQIKAGKFLLIAHGTQEGVTQAKNIIDRARTTEAVLHQG